MLEENADYKLTLLAPITVVEGWESIKAAMMMAIPPEYKVDERMATNALHAFRDGRLKAWALSVENNVVALVTTVVVNDTIVGVKILELYTLTGFSGVGFDGWQAGLDVLRVYAKEVGCRFIRANSVNPRVIEIAEALGGNAKVKTIDLEV